MSDLFAGSLLVSSGWSWLGAALGAMLAVRRESGGPGWLLILQPVIYDLGRGVERLLGGATSVRRRMERSGLRPDVEGFRAEQVVWGVGGGVLGVVVATLRWLKDGGSVIPLVFLVFCAVGAGVVARDQMLTVAATKRERQMLAEFPTVAELLALAVGAARPPAVLARAGTRARAHRWRPHLRQRPGPR